MVLPDLNAIQYSTLLALEGTDLFEFDVIASDAESEGAGPCRAAATRPSVLSIPVNLADAEGAIDSQVTNCLFGQFDFSGDSAPSEADAGDLSGLDVSD